jgi:diaminopimelate epimerase
MALRTGFSKYHGCQNDFLVFVNTEISTDEARRLCARHTGVGADGVAMVTLPDAGHPARMRIINADGSVPEMCGNALRCVVKHLVDGGYGGADGHIRVSTDSGVLDSAYRCDSEGKVIEVAVNMGPPRTPVVSARVLTERGRAFSGYTVSMGNPHFVVMSDNPVHDAREFGLALSMHQNFPEGTNASFVHFDNRAQATAVVYERGAGLTMACGTGACAIATVGRSLGKLQAAPVSVHLPGGTLNISLNADGSIIMRGPAAWVFDGH